MQKGETLFPLPMSSDDHSFGLSMTHTHEQSATEMWLERERDRDRERERRETESQTDRQSICAPLGRQVEVICHLLFFRICFVLYHTHTKHGYICYKYIVIFLLLCSHLLLLPHVAKSLLYLGLVCVMFRLLLFIRLIRLIH